MRTRVGWAARTGAALGGLVVLAVGGAILFGGVQLALLGGSLYYVVAGAALLATGVLLALRRPLAGLLYALVLAATLAWALIESGFAFWPLLPRLVGPAVLGGFVCLVLLAAPRGRDRRGALLACGALSVLCLGVVLAAIPPLYSWGQAKTALIAQAAAPAAPAGDWRYYGRDPGGARFAPFEQITPANVRTLKLAWTAHTGEQPHPGSEDQNTPMQVGDTLYVCTPTNVIQAMDADTGAVRWRHDPKVKPMFWNRCRGVAYYEAPAAAVSGKPALTPAAAKSEPAICARRILSTTIDARLLALDAATGAPCPGFGDNGVVDLKAQLGPFPPSFYQPTSMPTVSGDTVIIGGWVTDNVKLGEPSGVVRAFDVVTGKRRWAWDIGDPMQNPDPAKENTFTPGTPNVWSTPSFDTALNLVFLPTGNATPDYWGSHRSTLSEKYSSSVVAVDIATGKERWRYQTVHHDLWDYDVPAQPMLIDFPTGEGRTVAALVILTKRGQIFVLDRATGLPVSPVEEKPVPQNGVQPGEWVSPTQPYSVAMPTIGADRLRESMMWGVSPIDQLSCRIAFRKLRYDGDFTPPGSTKQPSLDYPGQGGGQNWGSGAWDSRRNLLIMPGMRVPQSLQLDAYTGKPRGRGGAAGLIPGSGPMTPDAERPPQSRNVVRYVSRNLPMVGLTQAPCLQPPHGTLTAVDLSTRKVAWEVPTGGAEAQGPFGLASGVPLPIGTVGLGGPVATASGLVFHAATTDPYLRAYDSSTGKLLWAAKLPVGVGGTPMTYVSPKTGKQYVAVSAGGARLVPGKGDYVMAFALP